MKTAKDLIIPFSWPDRRPILMEQFFYVPGHLDYKAQKLPFFEKEQPVSIEYCSGNGQWISDRARKNPEINWIAVEKKFERARLIWLHIHRHNLKNLAVACSDGLVFTQFYAPKTQEVFVNFPDPWPKLRHAKHRIIRPEFLNQLASVVEIGGKVTCVTDDFPYQEQIEQTFFKHPAWKIHSKETNLTGYGSSYFEALWKKRGKTIYHLRFERICY